MFICLPMQCLRVPRLSGSRRGRRPATQRRQRVLRCGRPPAFAAAAAAPSRWLASAQPRWLYSAPIRQRSSLRLLGVIAAAPVWAFA